MRVHPDWVMLARVGVAKLCGFGTRGWRMVGLRPRLGCRVGVAALVGLSSPALASPAFADREFSLRASANATSEIALAANTLLTCPASNKGCAPAQGAGTGITTIS